MADQNQDQLYAMRHSLAHIMATATTTLWPEAKLGVGPVVENGFYYDIDIPNVTISTDDFAKIEAEMKKIIKEDQAFEKSEKNIDDAIAWAKEAQQPYKEELLNDLKRSGTTVAKDLDDDEMGTIAGDDSALESVGFYTNGLFTDLCRGPHIESTGKVGVFKLMRVAGAYWRGNEKNPQMQRLYGVAFETQGELEEYLEMQEEAKKRDHRKLGKELDLFTLSPLVGGGLPLFTGTNGKTTTTKMVVHALRSGGKRVVTNSTGSNMTRGLISALLEDMTLGGKLRETDWFVFEMDEAYAPQFTKNLSINAVLALNVLRDQLDRYGEIDKTAQLIAEATRKADYFVYNIHDPLLTQIADDAKGQKIETSSFGVVKNITEKIKNEQNMFTKAKNTHLDADFLLTKTDEKPNQQQIEVTAEQKNIHTMLSFLGIHNALNATAACALLAKLEPQDFPKLFVDIKTMHPPFGRGEKLALNNKNITVALVKNPSGFTHNLETFVQQGSSEQILFIINDRFADGRDVSWLWDVNFKGVISENAKILCSGIRGYDMALRLKHDGYKSEVELDVERAVKRVMNGNSTNIVVIPTYTALYEARAALAHYGKVPRIW